MGERVLELVREQGLLAAERPVVVLYSGGVDSTCLLDVAARIAGPTMVTALHVNYGLREAAEDDERHCRQLSARLGVALEVRRVRRSGDGAGGNVQAWARDERYAAARELATARDADVAVGHTATDQVETILYRLASSPSRRALLGMRARDERRGCPVLLRPLLDLTRAHTRGYCEARGLAWREDASNASDAYARGRVRHELVPALERVHPAAQANVLALAARLRDEAAVLDACVDAVLGGRDGVLGGRDEVVASRDGVSLATLRALPVALARLIVQRLADAAAGGPAAGVAARAEEILALSDRGTAMLDLPSGLRATARRGVLTFAPTPRLRPMAPAPASPRRPQQLPK